MHVLALATEAAASSLSFGSLSDWVMIGVVVSNGMFGAMMVFGRRSRADGANEAAVKALTSEFGRLSGNLEKVTSELVEHRLEDREVHTSLAATQSAMGHLLEKMDGRVSVIERAPRRRAAG